MKNIVILGAGTAGTMMANKLVRQLPESQWRVTVIDRDDIHIYQPGLLFFPFGTYKESDILRPRKRYISSKVNFLLADIDKIDPKDKKVYLQGKDPLPYDILIVATGTRISPEQTEGLTRTGWYKDAFDFYTFAGAKALAKKLECFEKGRVVLNVVEMPIKCLRLQPSQST